MARQKGIIKLQGKIGDLSFYKTRDGYLAREKGGVDGERIKNDPAFARTRENGQEFGMAAKAGKLLRNAFRPMMIKASDKRVVSRLTKLMSRLRTFDTTSARGERTVGVAIQQLGAKEQLRGFNFDIRSILSSLLYRPYSVNTETGSIVIAGFVPTNHLVAPTRATHVSFTSAWGKVDFANDTANVEMSETINLPINSSVSNLELTPAEEPTGSGTNVHLLMVEFFQEINGVQYSLNDGGYNALTVVAVN